MSRCLSRQRNPHMRRQSHPQHTALRTPRFGCSLTLYDHRTLEYAASAKPRGCVCCDWLNRRVPWFACRSWRSKPHRQSADSHSNATVESDDGCCDAIRRALRGRRFVTVKPTDGADLGAIDQSESRRVLLGTACSLMRDKYEMRLDALTADCRNRAFYGIL